MVDNTLKINVDPVCKICRRIKQHRITDLPAPTEMKSDEDDDVANIIRRVPPNSKRSSQQELHNTHERY